MQFAAFSGVHTGMKSSIINSMKTAISLPDEIFEEISRAAEEENVSRSKIFVEAARKYLEYRESQKLLEALNKAYSEEETTEEKKTRKYAIRHYAKKVVKEKW